MSAVPREVAAPVPMRYYVIGGDGFRDLGTDATVSRR